MQLWFFPLLLTLYVGLGILLVALFRRVVRTQKLRRGVSPITIVVLCIAVGLLVWKNVTPTWWYAADHPEVITPDVSNRDYRVANYGWPIKFYEVEYGRGAGPAGDKPDASHTKSGLDYLISMMLLGLDVISWLVILTLIWLASEWLAGRTNRGTEFRKLP